MSIERLVKIVSLLLHPQLYELESDLWHRNVSGSRRRQSHLIFGSHFNTRQWIKDTTALRLKIQRESSFMTHFYDSLVAFCRKSFNKFRVISCLWYEREKNWSKNLLRQFLLRKFPNKKLNEWTHCEVSRCSEGWRVEKMKSVIKMIITGLRL